MKGIARFVFFLAVGAMMFTSCASKKDFTQPVRTEYKLTDEILGRIQFFVARDIILYRANSESGMAIENGEVVLTNNSSEDQLIIKAGTKGAFVKSEGAEKIAVRFEADAGKYLIFSGTGNYKGRYMLAAQKWDNKKGVITYGGEEYYVTPESAGSFLQFKLKKLSSYKKKSRVASGVDIN